MGFMKKAKIGQITAAAQAGWDTDDAVFVARYWDEVATYQGTGAVAGAAEAIEQVESVGWALDHASYAWVPEKRRGVSVLIFRRPVAETPPMP